MGIDERAFRETVGHFVTGVTVVAAAVDGGIKAMTANSFTSVSLDPPLVLFCIGKNTRMGRIIHSASSFSVNILHHKQQELSAYFAGSWKEPAPPAFCFVEWEGVPRLDGSAAVIGCAIHTIYEGGDHWIVVGRVRALYRSEESSSPLLFNKGQYVTLEQDVPQIP